MNKVGQVGFIGRMSRPITAGSILDSVTAAAAYSTRRLRTGYTGPAIRVRRSSDNAEQDIGFRGNDLNLGALQSFIGANSGFVTTWYDQSGAGINLTQATAALQPRIVNAGAVDLLGNRPTLFNASASTLLSGAAVMANTSEFFLSLVTRPDSFTAGAGSGITSWSMNVDAARFQAHAPWTDSNVYFDAGGSSGANRISGAIGVAAGTSMILSFANSVAGGFQRAFRNNTLIVSDATGHSITPSRMTVFGVPESDQSQRGAIPEMVVFSRSITDAERISMVLNQAGYFGITGV